MKFSQSLIVSMLVTAPLAQAQMPSEMKMSMPTKSASTVAPTAVMTDGVVQSVDATRGLVTLKHG